MFKLSIKNLGRMIAEFPEAFNLIFAGADKRLIKLLKQKIKTIKRIRNIDQDYNEIHSVKDFKDKFKTSIDRIYECIDDSRIE